MVYEWNGYKYPVSAQTVGEVCEQIEAERGSVTREALVDASRDENTPTHILFDWDDRLAGEQWRRHQAGKVLSCLKIQVINKDEKPQTMKAFVNVSEEPRAAYINIEKARLQPDSMAVVLKNALRELEIFRQKYHMLKELDPVFDAISKVMS